MRTIRRSVISVFASCFVFSAGASADPASEPVPSQLVAARSSVPGTGLVSGLFAGQPFEIKRKSLFVKLSLGFRPAVTASTLHITSCRGEFSDGVEVALYPGLRRFFVEGGVEVLKVALGDSPVESLAINFRHNSELCIKDLQFQKVQKGQNAQSEKTVAVQIRAPEQPLSDDLSAVEGRREKFAAAGIVDVLDQELTPRSDDDRWVFRFRSDGTFMIFGRTDDTRTAGRFTAIGDFEIKEIAKSRIKLSLEGKRLITPELWDGWLCGDLCAGQEPGKSTKVAELVEIEKLPVGGYMVRNRVRARSRTIPFSDIRVRTSLP